MRLPSAQKLLCCLTSTAHENVGLPHYVEYKLNRLHNTSSESSKLFHSDKQQPSLFIISELE
jgi:hypothetical protein